MQHMVSLVQLGVGLEECARWWCVALHCRTPYAASVKEIINSIVPEDGRISPKHVELK